MVEKIAKLLWRHFQTLMEAYLVLHVQTFSFWYLNNIFFFFSYVIILTTLLLPRKLKSKAENYHISLHILLLFFDYLPIKQKTLCTFLLACRFASVLPFCFPVNLLLVKSHNVVEHIDWEIFTKLITFYEKKNDGMENFQFIFIFMRRGQNKPMKSLLTFARKLFNLFFHEKF